MKRKYLNYYSDFKKICNEENPKVRKISKFIVNSASADEEMSTVDTRNIETIDKLEFNEQIENKYPMQFDLFDTELTDILSKTRKVDGNDSSFRDSDFCSRPCFTPLIILMEKSVLLPLRSQYHVLNEKGVQFLLRDSNLYGHL